MLTATTRLHDAKTVKEAIVCILSDRFPLTISEMRAVMRQTLTLHVSYQAIHKEVLRLLDSHVLARDGKMLLLNPVWLEEQRRFFVRTHSLYVVGKVGAIRPFPRPRFVREETV